MKDCVNEARMNLKCFQWYAVKVVWKLNPYLFLTEILANLDFILDTMLRKSFSAISTNLGSIEATVLGTKSQRQSIGKILRITRRKHDHISRNWESSNRQTNLLPGTTAQSKREILCSKLVRYSSS